MNVHVRVRAVNVDFWGKNLGECFMWMAMLSGMELSVVCCWRGEGGKMKGKERMIAKGYDILRLRGWKVGFVEGGLLALPWWLVAVG